MTDQPITGSSDSLSTPPLAPWVHRRFGKTGLDIPPVVFGATSLGNLFRAISDETKRALVQAWFDQMPSPVMIDTAGKYGAGLALEVIGRELEYLNIAPDNVLISNKLAWRRAPLQTAEPTFEPGVWFGLDHDAVQDLSYDGILRCWEEGNRLLGKYRPQLISVHDPDEFLAAAADPLDHQRRLDLLIDAYRALCDLRDSGEAKAVGIGAKNWRSIEMLSKYCEFDWVMFANSFTVLHHPVPLVEFIQDLARRDIGIINSALFHGGFLLGGEFLDYRRIDPSIESHRQALQWRDRFYQFCQMHGVVPFDAALAFGKSMTEIHAVALSTSQPAHVSAQLAAWSHRIPQAFWDALYADGLVNILIASE